MILDRDLDPKYGRKVTGNGKYIDKYEKLFLIFQNFF